MNAKRLDLRKTASRVGVKGSREPNRKCWGRAHSAQSEVEMIDIIDDLQD